MVKAVLVTSNDSGSTRMFKLKFAYGDTDVINKEGILLGVWRGVERAEDNFGEQTNFSLCSEKPPDNFNWVW